MRAHMVRLAAATRWEFDGPHSGHLVGEFPHETVDGERIESYIAPAARIRCGAPTGSGGGATGSWRCTWWTGIGGFFKQLLTMQAVVG